ncbi:MAG: TorF family putative porin [Saccharospirillaceae bacterium]|nr:TorF family putative porin [Saccharospirillaceae bacterium]MCD8533071.1 TorF family putative porin [Saccharospirillaceae bacterium]
MKKYVLLSLVLAPMASFAGVSADLAVVSDYRFNGVSQTDKSPALQAGLNYSHDSGLYAGTWASNVDFGGSDDTNLEWDYFLGFYHDFNPTFGIDVGYAQYTYRGASYSDDYNYGEYYAGLYFNANTTLYWYHAPEYFGLDTAHNVFKLSHSMPLGDYTLAFAAAHSVSDDKDVWAWDENEASYQYAEVAVSRTFHGFDIKGSLMTTTIDDDFNDNGNSTIVLSVKRSFELM